MIFSLLWSAARRYSVIGVRLVEAASSHLQRMKCSDPWRWHHHAISKHPTPITEWRRARITQERKPRLHHCERLKFESFVCYYGCAIKDRLQTETIVTKLIKITYIARDMSLLSHVGVVKLLWCSRVSLPIMCLRRFIDAELIQRRNRSEKRAGDRSRRKLSNKAWKRGIL
jgi:hypothetical protein